MPYSRPISRFYLTPPSLLIFIISIVLALFAVLAAYGRLAMLRPTYAFAALLIAYVVLVIGVVFRGV